MIVIITSLWSCNFEMMLKGVEMLNSANLTISIVGNQPFLHVMSNRVQKHIVTNSKKHTIYYDT